VRNTTAGAAQGTVGSLTIAVVTAGTAGSGAKKPGSSGASARESQAIRHWVARALEACIGHGPDWCETALQQAAGAAACADRQQADTGAAMTPATCKSRTTSAHEARGRRNTVMEPAPFSRENYDARKRLRGP